MPSDSSQNLQCVTEDLEELLKDAQDNTKWKFNIPSLRVQVEGLGPGSFTIVAARPEVGKTAFWSSLCASPGGFAEQGAKVLGLCNEEKANKIRLRLWSACTGFSKEALVGNREAAKATYEKIRGSIILYDIVGLQIEAIDELIKKHSPDIMVIDQLDKIRVNGEFNRNDEKLREVYTLSREIAKRHDIAVIGISQLSADAQGKYIVDYSMLEGSKTGKAAEADLIICIGTNEQMGNGRHLNLPKNKISGNHTAVDVLIQPELSRYVA